MMTLIDTLRELAAHERQNVGCVMITPADGGYHARLSIDIKLPIGADPKLPLGVTLSGFERYPDIKRILDWRVSAWDQVLEVLHDPLLSQPGELGTMQAAEKATVSMHGEVAQSEAQKHWVIVTHGPPRSSERIAWIRRSR